MGHRLFALLVACSRIYEPADEDGRSPSFSATANQAAWQFHRAWQSDYLCTDRDYGLRWSFAGPLPGMHCLGMNEPAEPPEHTWADNYLCAPEDYRLSWSTHDPIAGQTCVQIDEPWDSHTWGRQLALPAAPVSGAHSTASCTPTS